jgi:hypothetical protein
MTRPPGDIDTDLVDLSDSSLDDLWDDRSVDLLANVQTVLRQVERPRANLGGSGPPGRAD